MGYLETRAKSTNMRAKLYCNGSHGTYMGTSVCQSKYGLIQKIEFEKKVVYSSDCWPDRTGIDFEIETGKGFCHHIFMNKEKKIHSLTTYGYETFFYRK